MHKYDENGQMIKSDYYNIIHRTDGVISTAKNLKSVLRTVDRRDNNYGTYAHRAVPTYNSRDT